MAERLPPLDVQFLSLESATTPMQVATLDVFQTPPDGPDFDRLVGTISDRMAFVPRYRQRVQTLPAGLLSPVWTDDESFDLSYHVRRSALPRPGTMGQLRDLTARIMSRRLDRHRPLWETYLIEGLDSGRYAILTKSHQALVDGSTVDLGQLIDDDTPDPPVTPAVPWLPERRRSGPELVRDALVAAVRDPVVATDSLQAHLRTAVAAVDLVRSSASRLVGGSGPPRGPLAAQLCEQRRFVTLQTPLEAYRSVRLVHGGSVNVVSLATLAGALRSWLLTRGEGVHAATRVRTIVPVSVTDDEFAEPTSLGSQVTPHLVDLPVGEPSPVIRLHQVSYAFKAHVENGRAVSASKLAEISGFAPTTFHALGARVAAGHSPRSYELLVTNVPGPQFPLYAAGARLLASYPVLPLVSGHALAMGVTSYDGQVFYGISADRDAVPDVEVLGQCVAESLDCLI
jgi:diacylglycerol O-acyltransferase